MKICTPEVVKTYYMEEKLKKFIEDYISKTAGLEKRKHKAYFNAAVTGRKKYYDLYSRLEFEHTSILGNRKDFEFLSSVQDSVSVSNPMLKRQARLLYFVFKAHQVPSDIQEEIIGLETRVANKFSLFRAGVDGKSLTDNQVDSILESSTDSRKLKQVWQASKLAGNLVEEDVRRLVDLRNRTASILGYPDYHHMSLELSEQYPLEVEALFDHLDSVTAGGFKKIKEDTDRQLSERFGIKDDELMPWHYQDRFFQEAPAYPGIDLDPYYRSKDIVYATVEYFRGIGLLTEDIAGRSDLFERAGKNQHAFCINIDREDDVRVLCNIKPNRKWMNTMLHEFGHAVYEKYYSDNLPYILREPAHIFVTEAVAMFFGRLASDPLWMREMGIIDHDAAQRLAYVSKRAASGEQLVFSRWAQVMYHFEKSLYANPEQNLNDLWWGLAEKYQQLTPPDDMSPAYWASKIHVASAPCYYHNYLLGELLASQLGAKLKMMMPGDGHTFCGDPLIGRYFRDEVFYHGAVLPWKDLVKSATGSELDPAHYAAQFAGG